MIEAKEVSRYREIYSVLRDRGVIKSFKKIYKRKDKGGIWFSNKEENIDFAIGLRESFEDLGATFIKFGQMLSTRGDIFPREIIEELQKLQDDVAGFDYRLALDLIEQDLGRPYQEIFASFDKEAIAQGSIAQVHKARLKDGSPVAVKVIRPGIREVIAKDLEIIEGFAKRASKYIKLNTIVSFEDIVQEFRAQIFLETDFTVELRNLQKFQKAIEDDSVYCPGVYKDLCTKNFIVFEYIDGVSIKKLSQDKIERYGDILAKMLIESYSNQVFKQGYFHGDPHPGNIMVDDELKIYFVDFGIMGSISNKKKYSFLKMFLGIALNSPRLILNSVLELEVAKTDIDSGQFERDIQYFLDKYSNMTLREFKLATLMDEYVELLYRHRIKIDRSLLTLAKTIVILESVVEYLDPKSSFIELARPIAKKNVKNFISAEYFKEFILSSIFDSMELARNMPKYLLDLFRKLDSQGYSLGVDIEGRHDEEKILEKKIREKRINLIFVVSLIVGLGSMGLLSTVQNLKYLAFWKTISYVSWLVFAVVFIYFLIDIAKRDK